MNGQGIENARQDEFQQTRDRSLFWTLSLYLDRASVERVLGSALDPAFLRGFQSGYLGSARLRDAMEPLFNDIADRERLGSVDDFLLDTTGPMQGETIALQAPPSVRWTTEGVTYEASPAGLDDVRQLNVRRFWYAHLNGSMSYHLSFEVGYGHTPADFYFLSLLQKLGAPKEFTSNPLPAGQAFWRATDAGLGVFPLENIRVVSDQVETFWQFVSRRFQMDAGDLFGALARAKKIPAPEADAVKFQDLVQHARFIEIPDLLMPMSRQLFFFRDDVLFKRLLPPIDFASGQRPSRPKIIQEDFYDWYAETIQARIDALPTGAERLIKLDAAYWNEAMLPGHASTGGVEVTIDDSGQDDERPDGDERLQYLFLSGFNQNIIDFMNQDASEILDSTDPLYPSDYQSEESFFVRFANPRALITYVRRSRSLETGNDYIGTCPYGFLIHVTSLNNEFLARDYEAKTYQLVEDVRRLNDENKFKHAAEKFYKFRMTTYADYERHRYPNIFRYDTERDVFEDLEKLRGTSRKDAMLEGLVTTTENQTRDLEARLSKKDELLMNVLLGAVGLFGFFQLVFQWAMIVGPQDGDPKGVDATFSWAPPFLFVGAGAMDTLPGLLNVFALYCSMAFALVLAVGGIGLLIRNVTRE
jgi:hypothetical protein